MTPPQRLHSVGNSLSKKVIPVTCDLDGRLERRPLADLTPFQGNLKDLDDARYAKLKASILAEGFMAPVFVWQDKILDGHQRTTVLNGEGWDVEGGVPVIEIQADTEADAARKLLKLTSAYGKPQPEGVFDFMQAHELDIGDLADVDLPDFDEDALLAMLGEGDPQEEPSDEIPEPPSTPVTRPGDLWHLGKHRVLCGDSTSAEAVEQVTSGAVDLCLTDPPYGIGDSASDKNEYRTHDDSVENLQKIIAGFLPLAQAVARVVVLTSGNMNHRLYPAPTWTMAWFVPAGTGTGPWGFCCWQPILCFGKDPKLAIGKGSHPDALVHTERAEDFGHPCSKPINFWTWLLLRTSEAGATIYDPFLGSGTTLVAAHSEGRVCYGMELDPAYVDVCVQRWQEYTNQEAILDGDGRTFAEVKAERLSGEDVPVAEAAG